MLPIFCFVLWQACFASVALPRACRFMIIKRSRVCACTSERAQIAPRWLVKRRAECIAPSGNACTAKEYNGGAAHECVQVGTTVFYKLLTVSTQFFKERVVLLCGLSKNRRMNKFLYQALGSATIFVNEHPK